MKTKIKKYRCEYCGDVFAEMSLEYIQANPNATVRELIEKKNKIEAQIWAIKKGITIKNEVILYEEISNLIDGVGEGFVPEDYYANSRYYSSIPGVKNIRFHTDTEILVKIVSPIGMFIPYTLNVRGVEYRISISFSSKYREGIDY